VKGDRAKWEARYASGDPRHDAAPVPLLASWVTRLTPGRALDIGAGLGRHAILLAGHGWTVDAVDISLNGLAELRRRAQRAGVRVNLVAADLDDFAVRPASYDLIVQTFFLDLRLLPRLRCWLRPGGYLYIETHVRTPGERSGGRYALGPGELKRLVRGWEIVAYAEGDRPEGVHRFATAGALVRRPADSRPAVRSEEHTPVRPP